MSSIRIDRLTADSGTLECSIRATSDLERFFTDESFRTDYDVPIAAVPDGVLAIPVLAQVCPVAWANGADIYVDEVDATFARALADVKTTLCEMHDFLEGGTSTRGGPSTRTRSRATGADCSLPAASTRRVRTSATGRSRRR